MNDEDFLEMLESSIQDGQKLVVSHDWAKDLIHLAHKGLVAEKLHEALTARAFQRDLEREALAAFEATTKGESK